MARECLTVMRDPRRVEIECLRVERGARSLVLACLGVEREGLEVGRGAFGVTPHKSDLRCQPHRYNPSRCRTNGSRV